jgi:hypothetical protein
MTMSPSVIGARSRWLLVGAMVFALLGMHSLVSPMGFGPAGAPAAMSPAGMTSPGMTAGDMTAGDARTVGSAAASSVLMAAANHAPAEGHGHSLAHLCLAMLGAAMLALALGVLGGSPRGVASGVARSVHLRVSRLRAPPWVTPSLAELSVLRV